MCPPRADPSTLVLSLSQGELRAGTRVGPYVPFAMLLVATAVFAQQPAERARTEAMARRATERLQTLQRESDRLASQESTLLGDLRKLEIEREIKAAELKQVDTEAATVQAELSATTARMPALHVRARGASELAGRLIEIQAGPRPRTRLLLDTRPAPARRATRTVAAMGKLDRDRIVSHQRTLADLKSRA
jgi:septal ring factor EnvC (AmiA/AmiB activator)